MNRILLPFVRRAWYHIMAPDELLRERVIFDYELIYVKEGTATFTIEDEVYSGKPGDIFIFQPNRRHSIHVSPKGHMIQPHVHFDLLYRENRFDIPISFKNTNQLTSDEQTLFHPDMLDEFCSPFPCCLHPHNPKYIEFLLFELIDEYDSGHGKDNDPYHEFRTLRLFLRLWEQVVNEAKYSFEPTENQRKENAEKIRVYIEHHVSHVLTVEELSRAVHLSQGYIFRIFKEFYNISPIQYHTLMRVQKAKSMIRNTNMSITEISDKLGFHSVQDFCRAFKKMDGFSPSSYRRTNISLEDR